MTDLRALLAKPCTPDDQERCRADFGGHLDWACGQCDRRRGDQLELGEYTRKLLQTLRLRRAGYPLGANDLTLEEWIDLGIVSEALDANNHKGCPLL